MAVRLERKKLQPRAEDIPVSNRKGNLVQSGGFKEDCWNV